MYLIRTQSDQQKATTKKVHDQIKEKEQKVKSSQINSCLPCVCLSIWPMSRAA